MTDRHEYEIDPQKYALLDEVERQACLNSFFTFVRSFWSVIIAEKPVYNWHIPYLCGELEILAESIIKREAKPYDIIINIPPGTTKSTIVTIMFPAWLWAKDPTLRIISNSYSGDLSIEHATKSKDIIMSPKFHRLFPGTRIRRDKSGKGAYDTNKNGARYTTSTRGTITGKHAHVIINDDPLNPNQAASDVDRETANNHTKTLSSRKVDKQNTPVITIMQRLHEDDVTGFLLKKKSDKIKHICLPAESSGNVQPPEVREKYINGLLDPVRLSRPVLDEAKVDLGSIAYSGQYEQSPTVPGGNIIKEGWFSYVNMDTFLVMRQRREPIVFFGDTAFTEKAGDNDPSGFIGTCKIGQDLYITIGQKVFMEFPELIKFIPGFVRQHGYTNQSSIRIEPKANGKSVVQTLKRSTSLNVTETPSPRDDKKTRLTAVSPKVESGRVILVRGPWNEEFVDEVCGFPNKPHDEYVDLIAYAIDYHLSKNSQTTAHKAGYF